MKFSSRTLSNLLFCYLGTVSMSDQRCCHAQSTTGRQEGMEEIVLYDTTDSDAVEFQCAPLDETSRFNPRCNLNPSGCDVWLCSGSASLTYCDSEFFVPGRTTDTYQLFNCTDDNVVTCDSACTCVTGTFVGSGSSLIFEPDGGNCTILDSTDGSLAPYPTEAPSTVPVTTEPTSDSNSTMMPSSTSAPSMTSSVATFPTEEPMATDSPTLNSGGLATISFVLFMYSILTSVVLLT